MDKKVIFIVGPTSSGKTALAVELCKKYNGEIISADSRQVYIGMDLGTGKEGVCRNDKRPMPNVKLRKDFIKYRARYIDSVPQYLIDILEPGRDMYNLKNFIADANLMLDDIWSRGKIPFVVGGTGLYVSALAEGYDLPASKTRRGEWRGKHKPDFSKLIISLATPRDILYERIDKRLQDRINQGLVGEVVSLIDKGVAAEWLYKIGLEYRFTSAYIKSKMVDEQSYYDTLRFAIHAYARRQLTWLRHKISRVEWVSTVQEAREKCEIFINAGDRPGEAR